MNDRYKKLLGNTLIFAIGNFSAKLIRFLMMRVYSEVMTSSEYGIADSIFNVTEILIPVLSLGITEAVLRFALDGEENRDQILTFALKAVLIGGLVTALLSPLVSILLPEYAPYISLAVVYFLFYALRFMLSHFVRGIGKVRAFAVNGILYAFATAAFNILFLMVFKWGVRGYLLAAALSAAIACLHLFISGRLWQYIRLRLPKSAVPRQMLSYSIPLIPNSVSWWVLPNANRLILIGMYDLSVAGIYAMAATIPNAVTMVTSMFQQAWQISSVQEYEKKDRDSFYSGVFLRLTQITFPIGAALILACPLLARFLMQNEFYAAWVYIPMLVIAAIFSSFSSFYGTIYMVTKTSKRSMYTTLAGAVSSILLCFLLVSLIGVQGAALATMLGQAITCIARMIDTRRYVKLNIPPLRPILSVVILLAQSIAYIIWKEAAWPICALLFAASILIYIKELLAMAATLLNVAKEQIKKRREKS